MYIRVFVCMYSPIHECDIIHEMDSDESTGVSESPSFEFVTSRGLSSRPSDGVSESP